jgi:hypothetical protein
MGDRVRAGETAPIRQAFGRRRQTDMETLLIVIVVVLLLGGGGWYGRGRWY